MVVEHQHKFITSLPRHGIDTTQTITQALRHFNQNAQHKTAVREEVIPREVLSQEGGKKGLDKKADVQAQMDMARQAILIRAYLQEYVRANPVSDADLKKEYEAIKGRMGDKEYKPRHVLVETETEATAIIARLQNGTPFEEVA